MHCIISHQDPECSLFHRDICCRYVGKIQAFTAFCNLNRILLILKKTLHNLIVSNNCTFFIWNTDVDTATTKE